LSEIPSGAGSAVHFQELAARVELGPFPFEEKAIAVLPVIIATITMVAIVVVAIVTLRSSSWR
jgi:hypothetical protein